MQMTSTFLTPDTALSPVWRGFGQRWLVVAAELWADLVRGPAAPAAPPADTPSAPRYRHPLHGLSWDGRGRQPQWLRDAVLQEGFLLTELRCRPSRHGA